MDAEGRADWGGVMDTLRIDCKSDVFSELCGR